MAHLDRSAAAAAADQARVAAAAAAAHADRSPAEIAREIERDRDEGHLGASPFGGSWGAGLCGKGQG